MNAIGNIGRRGFILGVLGVAAISRGFTILSGETWAEDDAVSFSLWPTPIRIAIWVSAGLVALAAVAWPQLRHVAFAALGLALAQRLVGHAWSLVAWIMPGAPGGDPWAWAWVTWWGCLLWLLWLIARWVGEDTDAL